MILPFETSGKWSIKHGQDYMADIVDTRNIDMSQPGLISLSHKATALYTEDTDTDFGTVMAIVPISTGTSTNYFFVTSEKLFTWDASTSPFVQDPENGSPPTFNTGSDGVAYLGLLTASGTTIISSLSAVGGSWTSRVTGLTSTNPHPMCVHEYRRTLCWADGNIVYQSTTASYSDDSTNRLTIPPEYTIVGIRFRQGNIYIITRATGGTSAKMFVWNGSGAVAQGAWEVKCDWIFSLVDFDSSICVLTSAGQLLRFNGGGFTELASFPVYYTPYSWNTSGALVNASGRCANRGMVAHGDVLYLNIDGGINTSLTDGIGRYLDGQPSGLWVYDGDVGLYHRSGYVYTRFNSAAYTLSGNVLTFAAAHNLKTGDPVYTADITGVTGLVVNQMYYAIVLSATTISLGFSPADALAGNVLTVTGTPSGGCAVIIDTFDSIGAVYTTIIPGAVGLFVANNPPSILGSEIMFAGDITKTDGTTSISTLMSLGCSHGVGSFTTTPIPASVVTDNFQNLVSFMTNMVLPDATTVIKYRTGQRYGFPTQYRKDNAGLATWINATTFTIDTAYKNFYGSQVGDEVCIIEGAGAGYTGHIQSLDGAGPYRVVIDETIPGITVGMKSEVIVDNWQKLTTITALTEHIEKLFAKTTVGDTAATYIQFKVEMRGIDISLRKMRSESTAAIQ